MSEEREVYQVQTKRQLTIPESEAIANIARHFIIQEFTALDWPEPPNITPAMVRHILFGASKVLETEEDILAVWRFDRTQDKP